MSHHLYPQNLRTIADTLRDSPSPAESERLIKARIDAGANPDKYAVACRLIVAAWRECERLKKELDEVKGRCNDA